MENKKEPRSYPPYEKKWNHYFWNFFMLFLAISAGFLPENIRENRSDTHKEKDYMNSFYNDLKSDICPRWGPTLVSTDITPWMGQTVISTDITTRIEVMDLLWIKMIFIFS